MKNYFFLGINTLVTFILISCSHQGIKGVAGNSYSFPSFEHFKFQLDNACNASEGQGKIFYLHKQYAFKYETKWTVAQQSWAMALDVPLRGEESLLITRKQQLTENSAQLYHLSGSLKQLLDYEIIDGPSAKNKNRDQQADLVQSMLQQWAKLLFTWHQTQQKSKAELKAMFDQCHKISDSSASQCRLSAREDQTFLYENNKIVLIAQEQAELGKISMHWTFQNKFDFPEQYFTFQNLEFFQLVPSTNKRQKGTEKKIISIELYPNKCLN